MSIPILTLSQPKPQYCIVGRERVNCAEKLLGICNPEIMKGINKNFRPTNYKIKITTKFNDSRAQKYTCSVYIIHQYRPQTHTHR